MATPRGRFLTFPTEMLVKTSRSFAMVIQELGDELRDAVCIFYLVLRALDTVGTHPVLLTFDE
jgi:phytoene/squalene synthetase